MAIISARTMVILSVLFTILCLHMAFSRKLPNDLSNDVSPLSEGNLGQYAYKTSNYVKIIQPPMPVTQKNVGSHVEFYCEAMGSPPPTIQWYKGTMRITENDVFEDNLIIERSPGLAKVASRLVINYVLPRHEGDYYCVAEAGLQEDRKQAMLVVPNRVGREMNFTQLVANKILGAHHRPRVTFWAPAYMDIIGSTVILPCVSVGNPKPDLVWIDPANKEVVDDDKFEIRRNGELRIRSISWEDMGVYTCIIRNSMGEDSVETFLYPMQESK